MSEKPVVPIPGAEGPASGEQGGAPPEVDPTAETVVRRVSGSESRPNVVLACGHYTNVGRKRKQNQDSMLSMQTVKVNLSDAAPLGMYVVADGMGGQASGEVASGLVVSTLARLAQSQLFVSFANNILADADIDEWLRSVVEAANRAVLEERTKRKNDMGSTLVLAVVKGNVAYVAHVGDSRAYYLPLDGELERLTVDHSLVEQLVMAKQITAAEARTHKRRNVVYRTMGEKENIEIEVRVVELSPGDRLILCSDGLNSMIEDGHIAAIARESPSLMDAARRLVEAANEAGGEDNITVVVVETASL